MASKPVRLTVAPDSELARLLEAATDYLEIDTGDGLYRVRVVAREEAQTIPDHVSRARAGILEAAGSWKGLVDADEFKAYIAQRRRSGSRPSVHL